VGEFEVLIGAGSADIRLHCTFEAVQAQEEIHRFPTG
jgi:hypothetical protein